MVISVYPFCVTATASMNELLVTAIRTVVPVLLHGALMRNGKTQLQHSLCFEPRNFFATTSVDSDSGKRPATLRRLVGHASASRRDASAWRRQRVGVSSATSRDSSATRRRLVGAASASRHRRVSDESASRRIFVGDASSTRCRRDADETPTRR